ncbi:MAG: 16S rRNA (cytosine(1402)-N(4))-methyltransferase RsmH [Pyrinomonadaceae bacterium]
MSGFEKSGLHRSVLLDEVVAIVAPRPDEVIVDATLGLGGHAEAVLESQPAASVIGLDQDEVAIGLAGQRLERFGSRFVAVRTNFSELKSVIRDLGHERVDAVVADLGVSSMQFDEGERGFSFRTDAPLDMRMDRDSDLPTAADLLAELSEEQIADIIYRYGEERRSRKIARWIVQRRDEGRPVTTTMDLANLVERAIGRDTRDRIHPATRTFQALRIAVNRELDILGPFIVDAVESLRPGGRLAVITFHSLEDRIVKHTMQRLAGKCICPPRQPVCTCGAAKKVEVLTRKPILPSEKEIEENPRSRSAKLRACRKLAE